MNYIGKCIEVFCYLIGVWMLKSLTFLLHTSYPYLKVSVVHQKALMSDMYLPPTIAESDLQHV